MTEIKIRIGGRRGGEPWERFSLVSTLRLEVGDLAGDLAPRGFQTIHHEPVEPGTLGFSLVTEYGTGRRDDWSSTPGGFRDLVDQIDKFERGWDHPRAVELSAFGERWHLNTMRPACAHMGSFLVGDRISVPTFAGPLELFEVQSYVAGRRAWVDRDTREEIAHADAWRATCPTCGHEERLVDYVTLYDGVDHYGANRGLVCSAGTGYTYGSAWLVESLPATALAYLAYLGLRAPVSMIPTA